MGLKGAKKIIKKIGVKSWFEAGANVVEVGDKLLNSTDTFSRLDYYVKHADVEFCEEKDLKIPCGEIELNEDTFLRYNALIKE